ncbi:MAG TPA: FmdB family zinc ribbon protein [Microbacteriaceae bacterium]|nr:FmdB family zinc ribbon protein [Microbacteriaceae bacterium]
MPTYSYRCTECGNAFDTVQSFTDDALTECPSCGGRLRKIFAAVGVTFTGSGFYRNDSKPKPKADASSAPAATSAAPASASTPAPASKEG